MRKDGMVTDMKLHMMDELDRDGAGAVAAVDGVIIDLRDDRLSSMRGITTSLALSAPVWAAVAVLVWWSRHQAV
jgi:hypothetical protein